MFGGVTDSFTYFEDLWEWDGDKWFERANTGPGPRASHGLVYDQSERKTLLFGGITVPAPGEFTYHQDTWAWDGVNWMLLSEIGATPRRAPSMAYDPRRGTTLLFGGDDEDLLELRDLWEWNGVRWNELPINGPTRRMSAPMVYAAERHTMLVHGGLSHGNNSLGEMWELRFPDAGMPGDIDCSGCFDAFDIQPFLVALFDPGIYEELYPNCDISLADMNGDGSVSAFDIEAFIKLLFDP